MRRLSGLLLAIVLTGCSAYSPESRLQSAVATATAAGWVALRLPTDNFVLASFVPGNTVKSDTLAIYIEGDGLAFIDRSQASLNPTPLHAIGLELALRHARGIAAYLARPCQFVSGADARNCSISWWTDRRFAVEVVRSTDQAVEQLKRRFQARHVILVGYSGGGAIAALVAARRTDVTRLVTVAGNLDHAAWTRQHRVTGLQGSLNPADAWQALVDIPQVHFIGGRDTIIGPEVAESYRARFPADRQPQIRVIDGFDHACCWVAQWPELFHGE